MTRIATIVLATNLSYGIGACSDDLSCVETATCKPLFELDAGKDQAAGDGSFGDSRSDVANTGASDAPIDRLVSDAIPADRNDAAPAIDVANDARTAADASLPDVDVKPPNGDAGRDTSSDLATTVDVNIADTSVGPDRRDSAPIDVNTEPPLVDAGPVSDGRGADVFDASDVVDACKKNECGGCTVLTGTPGSSCGSCGTYACSGSDAVTCNDPGRNACNGCSALPANPGAACGSCGTYACSGTDALLCANDSPLNACGGCGQLGGAPGAKCGTCGVYACSSDKSSVTCDHPDPLKVTQLAAGYFHTCALLSNGAVRCWGYNGFGQLGDGSTATRLTPTGNVLAGATELGGGWSHTCARMSSGGLRCWGYNGNGELGDGMGGTGTTDYDRHSPPGNDIAGLGNVTAVSLGLDQTCAINAGDAYCWGANTAGQLGDMGAARNAPGPAFLGGVSAIGAGQSVTCGIAAGQVGCWGQHASDFQLAGLAGSTFIVPPRGGMGVALDAQSSLRTFYDGELTSVLLGNVSSAGVGRGHACAVTGGDVRCWGANNWGQLGEPSATTPQRAGPDGPVVVQGATAVVTGNEHSCALMSSGGVRCWGIVYTSTSIESPPTDVAGFCP